MSDLADPFPGYASEWIHTSAGRIFARVGGKGPPLRPMVSWAGRSIPGIFSARRMRTARRLR
ncbi:hypothetical protein V1282_002588 [Nitrobacteraceae bacterium AZCC 2146]